MESCMVEQKKVSYAVYDHEGREPITYTSRDTALRELAWNMVREKHRAPKSIGGDRWYQLGRLHERLLRYLKFIYDRQDRETPRCRECGERKADVIESKGWRCDDCVLTYVLGVIGAVLSSRVMDLDIDCTVMIESAGRDLASISTHGGQFDVARALYLVQHVDLNVKED